MERAADAQHHRTGDRRARVQESQEAAQEESGYDLIVADTRGLADDLSQDIAEESDVVFLPTGASSDDLCRRWRWRASSPNRARTGGSSSCSRKSAAPRYSSPRRSRRSKTAASNCSTEHWPLRDGFQADLDAGRAGREARNGHLRELAEKLENEIFERIDKAEARRREPSPASREKVRGSADEGLGAATKRALVKPAGRTPASLPSSGASAPPPSPASREKELTNNFVEHAGKIRGKLLITIERQHVRDVLVRSHDDQRALLAIDAAHVEDVGAALQVGQNIFS